MDYYEKVYFIEAKTRKLTQCTYWTDFLVGVCKLTCQAKIKHVAASAGTVQSSHGKVRLQFKQHKQLLHTVCRNACI